MGMCIGEPLDSGKNLQGNPIWICKDQYTSTGYFVRRTRQDQEVRQAWVESSLPAHGVVVMAVVEAAVMMMMMLGMMMMMAVLVALPLLHQVSCLD